MSANGQTSKTILQRWLTPLSMAAAGLLAFLLYSRALGFAFFNDDPTGHFAWMETRSFLDFFLSSAEYGYYRPIVFVTLKSLVALGGYSAPLFHALLLLLNSANVAMLWLLARRLSGSRAYGWAAALIFLTFPFSYEAVAYVASLTHPLLLFWLLLTILLYQEARKNGRRLVAVAAFITLLMGLFTHENGLFIPLALAGVDWLQRPPHSVKDAWKRPFLPYFGAAVFFLILWLLIPKNSDQGLASLDTALSNLYPFGQSLVYPLLPAMSLTAADGTALLLLGLVTLLLLLGAAVMARAVGLWLFALAWFGLSILPALLFLSSAYLYGSPRLNYLPAVGIALLLALPVLAMARRRPQKMPARAVAGAAAVLYVLLIALPPLPLINCEMDFYAEASDIVRQMAALAETAEAEQVLFANVPFFFSSYADRPQGCENRYPWTPVGAVVIPPYATARDFVRFNGGPDRPVTGVMIPDYGPGWNTFGREISLADVRELLGETAVYVYDLNRGDFFNLSAAWQPGPGADREVLAAFAEYLVLEEAKVSRTAEENEITVRLRWRVASPPESPVTVFVHLYDQNGALVSQHDGPPGSGFIPVAQWRTADEIVDNHTLSLAGHLPAGTYTLATGLYNPLDGQRLPAYAEEIRLANDIYTIQEISIPLR